MCLENEISARLLSEKEKTFVKSKLLEITSILKKWQHIYQKDDRKITLIAVKKLILEDFFSDYPSSFDDKKKILEFRDKYVPCFKSSLELAVLRSFAPKCRAVAKTWANKVSASLGISYQDAFVDLLQDAYASVLHSMYYFDQEETQLSTFVIGSLKRSLERIARYKYCKTSPVSNEDLHLSYRFNVAKMKSPTFTFEQIVESIQMNDVQVERLRDVIRPVRKMKSKTCYSENSFIDQIPCNKTSSLEELDIMDTVSLFKKLLDPTDKELLEFTREEKDVLRGAYFLSFEHGWQTEFAKSYINPATEKPYSRARIGQIFDSAIKKARPHFA